MPDELSYTAYENWRRVHREDWIHYTIVTYSLEHWEHGMTCKIKCGKDESQIEDQGCNRLQNLLS